MNGTGYEFDEDALKRSGYNQTLKFKPQQAKGRRKTRQRNVIWFNPPFSKNVKTRVAQEFLKLIDKHFSNNRKYRKIFNRNNVKVSYSSMPNIGSIISGHNKRVLEEKTTRNERQCNCRNPENCPLNGQCLAKGILYEAAVNSNIPGYEERLYKGITDRCFKERFKEHKKTFANQKYSNETELTKEIWRIKDEGGVPEIKWKILRKAQSYNPKTKRCALCLQEKLEIAEHEGWNMLNKRSEAVAKCIHQNKYALSRLDDSLK